MTKLRNKGAKKKGQEEMIGFVIIIIIVSVILLILLGFMLRSPDTSAVQNYEVENFIQASLQYTSSCETEVEFLSVQNLIVSCEQEDTCLNGKSSCEILNDTLRDMIKDSWNIKEGSAIKGYKFAVMTGEKGIFLLQEGNETRNYKGAFQDFAKRGDSYEVSLNVYS